MTSIAQKPEYKTKFETGAYTNNMVKEEILRIPDADQLEVSIRGETEENHDFIRIYDENGQEADRLSGLLNRTLFVAGSMIRVNFRSDGRTTKSGVTVSIVARTPASVFNEIKKMMLESAASILKSGSGEAYNRISTHLNHLKNLNIRVMQVENPEGLITDIAKQLGEMGRDYRYISQLSEEILKKHNELLSELEQLRKRTQSTIDSLQRKQANYQDLLTRAQAQLDKTTDALEKQKLQFSISGYEKILRAFANQRAFWIDFHHAQGTLSTMLMEYSAKLQVIFHILSINAQVYEQVSNLTSLRGTTVSVLENLTNLADLRKLVEQIEEGEKQINQRIEKVKSLDFDF